MFYRETTIHEPTKELIPLNNYKFSVQLFLETRNRKTFVSFFGKVFRLSSIFICMLFDDARLMNCK